MLATSNQKYPSTFPSNALQNPKNNIHFLAITTHSGQATMDPPIPTIDELRLDIVNIDEHLK